MNLIATLETALKKANRQDEIMRKHEENLINQREEINRLTGENKVLKDEHAKLLLEVQRLQRVLEVNNIIYPK